MKWCKPGAVDLAFAALETGKESGIVTLLQVNSPGHARYSVGPGVFRLRAGSAGQSRVIPQGVAEPRWYHGFPRSLQRSGLVLRIN